jgi:hypothetical protein
VAGKAGVLLQSGSFPLGPQPRPGLAVWPIGQLWVPLGCLWEPAPPCPGQLGLSRARAAPLRLLPAVFTPDPCQLLLRLGKIWPDTGGPSKAGKALLLHVAPLTMDPD